MFSLISRLSRSRKAQACEPSSSAARVSLVEALEDRRLNSASPLGAASFSWGSTQLPALAAEPGGESSIIAVNKASPQLFLAARKAGGEQQELSSDRKATPILFLTASKAGGEASIIAVL
jgi:hypothetical protein